MPPIHPFRLSLYASLAVAIVSLGVAGADLLIDIPVAAGVSLILLAFAFWSEGRWQLSLRDANFVGLCLAGLLGLWVIYRIVGPPTGLSDQIPIQAIAIPYFSPFLMILIPAKLLRPKHNGDYWTMHGLGVLAMALACALAADGAFILLFGLYCALLIWGLSTFHLIREMGVSAAGTVPLAGGRWTGVKVASRWALALSVLALPLFWLTPRTGSLWELGMNSRGRMMSGVGDSSVDLNKTGELAMNTERVLEIAIADSDGRPVDDFPLDTRFRMMHLMNYTGGRWQRPDLTSTLIANLYDRASNPPNQTNAVNAIKLPWFGAETRYLTYTPLVPMRLGFPLADPIMWRTGDLVPIISNTDRGILNWIHRYDSLFDPLLLEFRGMNATYTQAWHAPELPGAAPVMRINPESLEFFIKKPSLARLEKYTDDLFDKLVDRKAIAEEVRPLRTTSFRNHVPAKHHEAVARAIEAHLAYSGEFTYTLDLKRQDKKIDAAEDFLLNTKSGHCQRFAGALALMLRHLGIPTQVVLGYRGCEALGDGKYEVREDHAHAWVEILVPADASKMPPFRTGFTPKPGSQYLGVRWITLDPTPGYEATSPDKSTNLFSATRQKWEALTKSILIAYDSKARAAAIESIRDWYEDNGWYWTLGAIALLYGLFRLRRRWQAYRADRWNHASAPLRQLMALAGGWQPTAAGHTIREFARSFAERLCRNPMTLLHASTPEKIAESYYAERFGGRVATAAERAQLQQATTEMVAAVKASGILNEPTVGQNGATAG
jgi:protein-glutamine gamma-glutamyltransferase